MPPRQKAVETKVEMVKFAYDGDEYEVRADFPDTIAFHEHIEDGNYMLLARDLLGPRQWRAFQAAHEKYEQALELVNAWGDRIGLGK
jgi:hypothetical protein